MNNNLYEYLEKEWKQNNHLKYLKYFDVWINNLTDDQIFYYKTLWMKTEVNY